jgi:hypothetical protein
MPCLQFYASADFGSHLAVFFSSNTLNQAVFPTCSTPMRQWLFVNPYLPVPVLQKAREALLKSSISSCNVAG